MNVQTIQNKIYEVRSQKVMLDFDLAELYQVETRVFNQAVKRNSNAFPEDFMFRLTAEEWKEVSSSQIVMMDNVPKNRTGKYLPYAFTEHGVTMLASVLRSDIARKMNIAIVRAFIAMRKMIVEHKDIIDQMKKLEDRLGTHDIQLKQLYQAIAQLLDNKAKQQDWDRREKIGFKTEGK